MTSPSVWKIVWVSLLARIVVYLVMMMLGLGYSYVTLGKQKFWELWEKEKKKHGVG